MIAYQHNISNLTSKFLSEKIKGNTSNSNLYLNRINFCMEELKNKGVVKTLNLFLSEGKSLALSHFKINPNVIHQCYLDNFVPLFADFTTKGNSYAVNEYLELDYQYFCIIPLSFFQSGEVKSFKKIDLT